MTDLKNITDTKTLLDIYTNALLRSEREHVAALERGEENDHRSIATIKEMEEIMKEIRRRLEETEEEKLTDRELLRVLVDELYEFTGGEVWDEGPTVISGRLNRLAERIEKHLETEKKE